MSVSKENFYIVPNVSGLRNFFITGELKDEGMPSMAKPLKKLLNEKQKVTILVYPHYCKTTTNYIIEKKI